MTGSELSLILILTMVVRLVLLMQPWPIAVLVILLALEGGRRSALTAAAGIAAAAVLWFLAARTGLAAPFVAGHAALLVQASFLILCAALAWLSLRRALGHGPWTPRTGHAGTLVLPFVLYAVQPGVGTLWSGGDLPILALDLTRPAGAALGLALVAAGYGLLAWAASLGRLRAAFDRSARPVHAVAAALFIFAALASTLATFV
ncbi:MAG: hypothetical protein KDK12_15225 [Rhodobacteraceae bacterium]|nr:hypothetical protein [Paracoccaceae bacterium]